MDIFSKGWCRENKDYNFGHIDRHINRREEQKVKIKEKNRVRS